MASPPEHLPRTLRGLRESGWVSRPVAEELRSNTIRRLSAGEPLVEGVHGYEATVVPQIANALLARHDMVLLGERGQAKTRIIRSLVGLLDEWMPIVAGSEINDDPFRPVSRFARDLAAETGEDLPISWVHRADRYGEKLATPDTSIADLIGEVDPVKVAEGRYLSDELTLHYGLIPRTNRGVFAINELPDLAERIQVGLLNVLEERDVQIRGYKVRLPLDVFLVASANPEDYTNRGRMITPLKDRFGAQIRTHYPLELVTEMEIMRAEAVDPSTDDVAVEVPDFLVEVLARLTHLARRSPHISQHSGVSVRMSVANLETLGAAALRRALVRGEKVADARVGDLAYVPASTMGRVEIETLDDGREHQVMDRLVKAAVLAAFREHVPASSWSAVVGEVEEQGHVEVGDDVPLDAYGRALANLPALAAASRALVGSESDVGVDRDAARMASAAEFILEGLHLSQRLNKDTRDGRAGYSA